MLLLYGCESQQHLNIQIEKTLKKANSSGNIDFCNCQSCLNGYYGNSTLKELVRLIK